VKGDAIQQGGRIEYLYRPFEFFGSEIGLVRYACEYANAHAIAERYFDPNARLKGVAFCVGQSAWWKIFEGPPQGLYDRYD
jgi:hypothetical protein